MGHGEQYGEENKDMKMAVIAVRTVKTTMVPDISKGKTKLCLAVMYA